MSESNLSASETTSLLKRLADRLSSDPAYMASALSVFQKTERIDHGGLARLLGTTAPMLARMAICKRPDPSSERFADDVRQIARYTACDAGALAGLLRQINALQRLSEAPASSSRRVAAPRGLQLGPRALAAARDRPSDEEEGETPALQPGEVTPPLPTEEVDGDEGEAGGKEERG